MAKYTSKKQVIAHAQEIGSASKTFPGAARYILQHAMSTSRADTEYHPAVWTRNADAKSKYIKTSRAGRLIKKYVGLKRLPGYLSDEEKSIIRNHPANREFAELMILPDFVRGFYLNHVCRIDRYSDFIKKCHEAQGILNNGGTLNSMISRVNFDITKFGRTRRNHEGDNSRYPGIRTTSYQRGQTGYGFKYTHYDYYSDYTFITPRTTKNVFTAYLQDSNDKKHKVFVTNNYIKIDAEKPIKIKKTTVDNNLLYPVHIQRRMINLHLPKILKLDYDKTVKKLMIVDSLGEQYHLYPVRPTGSTSAKNQVKEAIIALKKRRAEKIAFSNPEKIWVSIEDSYNSGNCKSMSDRFYQDYLTKVGATGDICTRADLLLLIRNDSYTRRAVQAAAGRYV